MSVTHLLCYIRRNSLTSWKLDSLERGTRNNPVLAYGSNDRTFAKFAKRGNVLWIIGAYSDGPPSLEAKIEISTQLHKDKEWDFEVIGSYKGSAFFGLNDTSKEIMQLVFENNRSLWSLQNKYSTKQWNNMYGRHFQAPRRLAPTGRRVDRHISPGAEPLERLADVAINRSVFVSWKHSDNNQNRRTFIKALTMELRKRRFSVWWDKTALTNVEAVDDYSDTQKDEIMDRLLRQGLSQCTAVLALWTKRYGTASNSSARNWTRDEWNIKKGKITRFAMAPDEFESKPELVEPDRVIRISANPRPNDAVAIARLFAKAYGLGL